VTNQFTWLLYIWSFNIFIFVNSIIVIPYYSCITYIERLLLYINLGSKINWIELNWICLSPYLYSFYVLLSVLSLPSCLSPSLFVLFTILYYVCLSFSPIYVFLSDSYPLPFCLSVSLSLYLFAFFLSLFLFFSNFSVSLNLSFSVCLSVSPSLSFYLCISQSACLYILDSYIRLAKVCKVLPARGHSWRVCMRVYLMKMV